MPNVSYCRKVGKLTREVLLTNLSSGCRRRRLRRTRTEVPINDFKDAERSLSYEPELEVSVGFDQGHCFGFEIS